MVVDRAGQAQSTTARWRAGDKGQVKVACTLCSWVLLALCGLVSSLGSAWAADLSVPYEVAIEGVSDTSLVKDMEATSDTVTLKDHPPASLNLLRRRMEKDRDVFMQLLRAKGYYSGRVDTEMDVKAQPVRVLFRVNPGPQYLLKSLDLRVDERISIRTVEMPSAQDIGLPIDRPFATASFLDGEKKLLTVLGRKGFPFARITERKVVVDHAIHSVLATLWIDPGRECRFGPTDIAGLSSVKETFVRMKIPWQEGDLFNVDLLGEYQKRLIKTGLFSTVGVSKGETPDEQGRVPVCVALTERKHRSVGAGVNYKTDEGLGGKFSWEHRNLLGGGERLGLVGTISSLTYSAEGVFRKPYFLRKDQSLNLMSRLAEDKPDAYTSLNFANSAILERHVTESLKVSGGGGFKQSRVTQLGVGKSYSLVFLPLQMTWDGSDDLMDPKKGARFGLKMTPYYDLGEEGVQFVRSSLRGNYYLQILKKPSTVLASRISFGIINGAERLEVPADERLYSGGGGSIRGYPYQSVGPLVGTVPTGGKSLFEVSLEARMRITERIGLACFLDGGRAFEGTWPSSEESLLWGGGIGLRYFTPVGPFRIDLAVPLNRRDDIDDPVQIYVSLGQAF